jgi:DNA-binding YbaB/EbfC family protein
MNMQAMMKQMQKMQTKMLSAKEEIEAAEYEGEAGSGKVKLLLTGKGELRSISIDKSVVDPEDVDLLEDLIITAFKDAKGKADAKSAALMDSFRMPGLPGF